MASVGLLARLSTSSIHLLLLVVDLADPDWEAQLKAVQGLLDQLGCNKPRQVVANQIDRCHAEAITAMIDLEPQVIFISATDGTGLKGLKQRLERTFWNDPAPEEHREDSEEGREVVTELPTETSTDTVALQTPNEHAPPWPN